MSKPPAATAERTTTPRAAIREAILDRALSAHEISVRASVSEKDVAVHLEHIERSLRAKGDRLVVQPASCLGCGFVFRDRRRFTNPGSCPKCASEHVAAPTFRIEPRAPNA